MILSQIYPTLHRCGLIRILILSGTGVSVDYRIVLDLGLFIARLNRYVSATHSQIEIGFKLITGNDKPV